MSRLMTSKPSYSSPTLGQWLRQLRKAKKLPLRAVAAVADMDSTLLSKIELGQRLPTEDQVRAIAAFYKVSADEMEAKRIAEKFIREHKDSPAMPQAVSLIREARPEYTKGGRR